MFLHSAIVGKLHAEACMLRMHGVTLACSLDQAEEFEVVHRSSACLLLYCNTFRPRARLPYDFRLSSTSCNQQRLPTRNMNVDFVSSAVQCQRGWSLLSSQRAAWRLGSSLILRSKT